MNLAGPVNNRNPSGRKSCTHNGHSTAEAAWQALLEKKKKDLVHIET